MDNLILIIAVIIILYILMTPKDEGYELLYVPNADLNTWANTRPIPLNPEQLCETRCVTNLENARILGAGMSTEECIMKCYSSN